MYAVVVAIIVLAVLHILLGLVNICIGVTTSIQAEVWMAHTVSPIWSGVFFMFTGILGFACAHKKTTYLVMCFAAFTMVSLVVSIIAIQLLRLGLVDRTSDGQTFQKEEKDVLIIAALAIAGAEGLVSIISGMVSCRMARAAKKELFQRRAEAFHVQVFGQKDVEVIVTKYQTPRKTPKSHRTATKL